MIPTHSEIADADREALTRRPAGRPVMYQSWDHLLFLHWEVPADAIRRLLPPGLEVDPFEGRAYVGLVPFSMRGVRPAGLPAVRRLSDFHETNVRTYVHAEGREPGVWFFSLDAANASGGMGRAWFRLPYFFARMGLGVEESPGGAPALVRLDRLYPGPGRRRAGSRPRSARRRAGDGRHARILPGRALPALRGLEGRALFKGRVHHTPYPLRVAGVRSLEESMLAASGSIGPTPAPGPLRPGRGRRGLRAGAGRGSRRGRDGLTAVRREPPSRSRKSGCDPVSRSGEGDVERRLAPLERAEGDRGGAGAGRPEVRAVPPMTR